MYNINSIVAFFILNFHIKYYGSIKLVAATYHYAKNCNEHDEVEAMIKHPNDSFQTLLAYSFQSLL